MERRAWRRLHSRHFSFPPTSPVGDGRRVHGQRWNAHERLTHEESESLADKTAGSAKLRTDGIPPVVRYCRTWWLRTFISGFKLCIILTGKAGEGFGVSYETWYRRSERE